MASPQWFVALDQFVNTLFGGNAYTSLSSRLHLLRRDKGIAWPAEIVDFLVFWQKKYGGHCNYAYWTDRCRWANLVRSEGKDLGLVTCQLDKKSEKE